MQHLSIIYPTLHTSHSTVHNARMSGARLGQHFLHDRAVLRVVADALQIAPGDIIIEIGAGHGELTSELLALSDKLPTKPPKIIALEKDSKLAEQLRTTFSARGVEIIESDVREILPSLALELKAQSYKLVGNIPYYLTGFLLRIVGDLAPLPARAVFTMQKEVAERIAARPSHMTRSARSGSSRACRGMNQLAASVQFWAKPKILGIIPRSAFVPPPEVDSAIIVLTPQTDADITQKHAEGERANPERYYAAVHALFRQPRKTLLNNIVDATNLPKNKVAAALERMGIGSTARPHNLSLSQISALAADFAFPAAKSPREERRSARK